MVPLRENDGKELTKHNVRKMPGWGRLDCPRYLGRDGQSPCQDTQNWKQKKDPKSFPEKEKVTCMTLSSPPATWRTKYVEDMSSVLSFFTKIPPPTTLHKMLL